MTQLFTNNASGTLATELSDTANILVLQADEGDLFPPLSGPDFFQVTVEDTAGNIEIIRVDGEDGDELVPLVRGQENTQAQTFPPGSRVEIRMTVATLDGFLQKLGGTMTGTLDMNNEQITDPLIVGGEARNMPLRGADGGVDNQIIVPTADGAPTIGLDIIVHKGIDGIYALGATTVVANLPITESQGDLSGNLIFDFTLVGLDQLEGNALVGPDEMLWRDASAGGNGIVAMRYDNAGIPVVVASGGSISDGMANTMRTYVASATPTFGEDDLVVGSFIMFQQLGTGVGQIELVAAGDPFFAANGLKTAKQYSIIVALKVTATEFAIFGDTIF